MSKWLSMYPERRDALREIRARLENADTLVGVVRPLITADARHENGEHILGVLRLAQAEAKTAAGYIDGFIAAVHSEWARREEDAADDEE